MSTNLHWKPSAPRKGKTLGCGMKWIAQKQWGDGGFLHGEVTLTERDLEFLRGVVAATDSKETRTDASSLIEAIEKHQAVDIWCD